MVKSVEEVWLELVSKGLESKSALLKSSEFKSMSQAGHSLDISKQKVREYIDGRKLFGLRESENTEFHIPVWALDRGIFGTTTLSLHDYARKRGIDEWWLYYFLSTPCGNLNGLEPFKCLMSDRHLSSAERAAREELIAELDLETGASLHEVVMCELKMEFDESQPA